LFTRFGHANRHPHTTLYDATLQLTGERGRCDRSIQFPSGSAPSSPGRVPSVTGARGLAAAIGQHVRVARDRTSKPGRYVAAAACPLVRHHSGQSCGCGSMISTVIICPARRSSHHRPPASRPPSPQRFACRTALAPRRRELQDGYLFARSQTCLLATAQPIASGSGVHRLRALMPARAITARECPTADYHAQAPHDRLIFMYRAAYCVASLLVPRGSRGCGVDLQAISFCRTPAPPSRGWVAKPISMAVFLRVSHSARLFHPARPANSGERVSQLTLLATTMRWLRAC